MKPSVEGPDAFPDFRAFLKAAFERAKKYVPGFSLAVFARRATVSRSHLKNVMDYGANLSPAAVESYVSALRLPPADADAFRLMVRRDQARTSGERAKAEESLREWRYARDLKRMECWGVRADWAFGLVLSLSKVRGFRPEPSWISRRLLGRISPPEARFALTRLKAAGLLVPKRGRLVRPPGVVRVQITRGMPSKENLQKSALREALAIGFSLPGGGVEGSHSAMGVFSEGQARELVAQLSRWFRESLPRSDGPRDGEVYVVLGQIFPVSGRRLFKRR